MPSPKSIVDKTYNLGQIASSITDHGVMFSMVDHFSYAKEKGQKALAGFEAYVVGNHKERTNEGENARQHLLLLAKNEDAYKKLSYWCSMGATDGFYYRPRIDDEIMRRTGGEGIIASSACIGGRIPQFILNDNFNKAVEAAKYYNDFFEEFYLEIQPTMDEEQIKVNMGLLKIAEKLDIPMIVTSDFHYTERKHSKTHDVLLALQTGKLITDPNRWRFKGDTYFIASRNEMEQLFNENGHHVFPKDMLSIALDNTVKIANNCTFELELGKSYLPNINVPIDNEEFSNWNKRTGKTDLNGEYLKYLCIKGLKSRGLTDKKYKDRLEYELKVIGDMGFNDYFLIYYDIMDFCRKSNIPYGPGRGCATKDNIVSLTGNKTKLIQDIIMGDIVKGHDEQPRKVLWTYEYPCKEEVVSLETENNKLFTMTKDHKVYAIKKQDYINGSREPKWYPMDSLNSGDYMAEID